jgi:hypothetical protein
VRDRLGVSGRGLEARVLAPPRHAPPPPPRLPAQAALVLSALGVSGLAERLAIAIELRNESALTYWPGDS